jgi:AGCS family alanine or glycine:cation symporter
MTIMVGIKRGLFSNEAGEGSAPNVAATADISHPVKQGLIQALGVFTDTLVVCSCTAFMVLVSGLYDTNGLEGIQLTQASLESQVGSWGTIFVAIALFLFAFSSIIGNYYYGEANIRFLTDKKWALTVFRIFSGGVFVFFGAVASFEFVWNMGDLFMGLLTLCNLVALVFLCKYVFKLLDNYRDQKRRGIKDPVFHRSDLPEVADDLDAWE